MTGLEPLPGVVLEWGGSHRRDLPWRHTRDPWEVLVAEVMLQRTGADRVSSYWSRFLTRFPTPAACASAPLSEVIVEWTGLGYNRRALNLHRCAVALVDHHGGQVPENYRGSAPIRPERYWSSPSNGMWVWSTPT